MGLRRLLFLTDVHVGHHRVHASVIHQNLKLHVYPHLTEDLDVLVIGGDFFHRLLDMNSSHGYIAGRIIDELNAYANTCGFLIRVVRGTFSHDRLQNQWFTLNESPTERDGVRVTQVFDNIEIETIESLDLRFMYIPDDLPFDNAIDVVRSVLSEHQLEKVDFIVNHGYFRHMLPTGIPHEPPNTFNAIDFDDLVHGAVLNGHIHTPSVYRKVISGGSFERLNHGEEEAKGFFLLTYDTDTKVATHEFIENTTATMFKSYELSGSGDNTPVMSEYVTWLSTIMRSDKSTSDTKYIRLISSDKALRIAAATHTKEFSRQIDVVLKSPRQQELDAKHHVVHVVELPIITEANLASTLSAFLDTKHDVQMSAEAISEVLHV